jgi:hypothetical protein
MGAPQIESKKNKAWIDSDDALLLHTLGDVEDGAEDEHTNKISLGLKRELCSLVLNRRMPHR